MYSIVVLTAFTVANVILTIKKVVEEEDETINKTSSLPVSAKWQPIVWEKAIHVEVIAPHNECGVLKHTVGHKRCGTQPLAPTPQMCRV